jgi:hypothetical protein
MEKVKDDIWTSKRIYRGIVAWPKADGPKEQIGINVTNKCPEDLISKTGKNNEYTGEYKIIYSRIYASGLLSGSL